MITSSFKRMLLLGELADLRLYETLRVRATGDLARTLDGFIETEKRHSAFWRALFSLRDQEPDTTGRIRNFFIRFFVRVFGDRAAYLLLEAVETHGVKKYLDLWEHAKDPVLRDGLKVILTEELLHEDEAATNGSRSIDPGMIRNVFLGFNDGSVEILGAVTGLAAALNTPSLVAISALTVSVAGSLSMAAGAFLSAHSEAELLRTERAKQRFLQNSFVPSETLTSPLRAGLIVGCSYLVGASVPVLPFLFGAHHSFWSIFLSGSLILFVSSMLAFLSGMNMLRRVLLNTAVVVVAVMVSYAIGLFAERILA